MLFCSLTKWITPKISHTMCLCPNKRALFWTFYLFISFVRLVVARKSWGTTLTYWHIEYNVVDTGSSVECFLFRTIFLTLAHWVFLISNNVVDTGPSVECFLFRTMLLTLAHQLSVSYSVEYSWHWPVECFLFRTMLLTQARWVFLILYNVVDTGMFTRVFVSECVLVVSSIKCPSRS